MGAQAHTIREDCFKFLGKWLESCTRRGGISRNTVAVGIVVFDHLRRKCPVSREDVISGGGELKGARAGLGEILEKYGVNRRYLKEVTTRQAGPDSERLFEYFEWGEILMGLSAEERDELSEELIEELAKIAREWLLKGALELDLDRGYAPSAWINLILKKAKGRSGGVVEQHLVGAKLEKRYQDIPVPNYPAHAGDVQTQRPGDFAIQNTVYHVTATPSPGVIQRCAENITVGQHPVLLVPGERVQRAIELVEIEGVDAQTSIISIEDFLALNIIEMAAEEGASFFRILQGLVEIYNRRLTEVETDLSLRIEVR